MSGPRSFVPGPVVLSLPDGISQLTEQIEGISGRPAPWPVDRLVGPVVIGAGNTQRLSLEDMGGVWVQRLSIEGTQTATVLVEALVVDGFPLQVGAQGSPIGLFSNGALGIGSKRVLNRELTVSLRNVGSRPETVIGRLVLGTVDDLWSLAEDQGLVVGMSAFQIAELHALPGMDYKLGVPVPSAEILEGFAVVMKVFGLSCTSVGDANIRDVELEGLELCGARVPLALEEIETHAEGEVVYARRWKLERPLLLEVNLELAVRLRSYQVARTHFTVEVEADFLVHDVDYEREISTYEVHGAYPHGEPWRVWKGLVASVAKRVYRPSLGDLAPVEPPENPRDGPSTKEDAPSPQSPVASETHSETPPHESYETHVMLTPGASTRVYIYAQSSKRLRGLTFEGSDPEQVEIDDIWMSNGDAIYQGGRDLRLGSSLCRQIRLRPDGTPSPMQMHFGTQAMERGDYVLVSLTNHARDYVRVRISPVFV